MNEAQTNAAAAIKTTGETILAKIEAARAEVAANPHLAGQFYLVADTGGGLVVNSDGAHGYRLSGMFSPLTLAFDATAKEEAYKFAGHWNRRITPAQRASRCTVTVTTREEAWSALEKSWRETFAMIEAAKKD
ncbi:hypothetical protein HOU00_gp130 [Caulobacter phage CcrPW]|uniref:Uncharacterized protein n=1 Tax=Caulobacter phage CcrPW TaxID=2283271 RepID=A0A385EC19_9CAUD|nr:hypothetical protein HOU00_gp006 [Caulobacter phage CcrPW]YP_009809625.1 hypothetical protein HOU00_gp130 [Caulobacter phage CcrPW]AXQ68545.1 hypothetical protein CcrPW_gp006 [Caulobacter phage CcrPW]AXQ68995.1 hypothetical protein CcrPW_gp456 [Caulobacter phage CcrPW]